MDGSAFRGLGEAVAALFYGFMFLLIVAVPLAIWKLIDIAIWFYSHLGVVWK